MGGFVQCCCTTTRISSKSQAISNYPAEDIQKLNQILEDLDINEAFVYTKMLEMGLSQYSCQEIDQHFNQEYIQTGIMEDDDLSQLEITEQNLLTILKNMEIIQDKSSKVWIYFFQLFKSPSKKGNLNQSTALTSRDAGRLSNMFSDDENEDFLNRTGILPMKSQISIEGVARFSKTSRRNIFEKKIPPRMVFDLKRVLIGLYMLSNSSIEVKARYISALYEKLTTENEIMEIFEAIVFVALKAVPHYAINDLVIEEKERCDTSFTEFRHSVFSNLLKEKVHDPDELINLVQQYRNVQNRLVLYMVSKFCENLGHSGLSRNSHLSNQFFIIETLSPQEFVKRANKLNQKFFLIPGIWSEAKKESNEMIRLMDESFITKLDSIRFARMSEERRGSYDTSFRFSAKKPVKNRKFNESFQTEIKPRLIQTSRCSRRYDEYLNQK